MSMGLSVGEVRSMLLAMDSWSCCGSGRARVSVRLSVVGVVLVVVGRSSSGSSLVSISCWFETTSTPGPGFSGGRDCNHKWDPACYSCFGVPGIKDQQQAGSRLMNDA